MAKVYRAPFQYRVDTYRSESPTMESIMWTGVSTTAPMNDLETAKDVFDRAARVLQEDDERNACRRRQEERTEIEALQQRGTTMRFETWERHEGDRKYWFGLALYVIIPKAA